MAKHEWTKARAKARQHYDDVRRRATVQGVLELARQGASEDELVALLAQLEEEAAQVQERDMDDFVLELVDDARERAICGEG